MPNHYEALGVSETASTEEIKAAFRAIAKTCHPDLTTDEAAVRRMALASSAWSTLKDDKSRKAYDQELREDRAQASDAEAERSRADASGKKHTPCVVCGFPAFSGGVKCWRCLLREAAKEEAAKKAREKAERKARQEEARKRAYEKQREQIRQDAARRAASLNEASQHIHDTTNLHGYDDPIHAPDAEALLEAILSDSALRAARGVQKNGVNVWVHITPDMRVEAQGETVQLVKEVHKGLKQANRLFDRVRKWLGG